MSGASSRAPDSGGAVLVVVHEFEAGLAVGLSPPSGALVVVDVVGLGIKLGMLWCLGGEGSKAPWIRGSPTSFRRFGIQDRTRNALLRRNKNLPWRKAQVVQP